MKYFVLLMFSLIFFDVLFVHKECVKKLPFSIGNETLGAVGYRCLEEKITYGWKK